MQGALRQMKGLISLRFMRLRHSISQHFSVLHMSNTTKRGAAVVVKKEDVIADLPSSLVSLFVMLRRLFFVWFPLWIHLDLFLSTNTEQALKMAVKYYCAWHKWYLCSENGSQYDSSPTNNSWNTRSTLLSFFILYFILYFARYWQKCSYYSSYTLLAAF